jgi:peptide/nickel transport system substrate-binding protein
VEVIKRYTNEASAVQDTLVGRLDMYFWGVPSYMLVKLQNNPNVKVYLASGGIDDILVNPCPTQKNGGPFNPFSIREVRFALNYLIDRQAIVSNVLNGYGFAIVSPLTPVNPDYLTAINVLAKYNFKYDFIKAKRMITEALTKAGAVFKNGKWYYNGKPIVIKFMIRNDDPVRKQIGDMLANDLERLGFTVDRIYGDFLKAYQLVYSTDPGKYEWTLYTEGWGSSAMSKYSDSLLYQMYSPFFGYMPGWATPGFCNYKNSMLDKLGKALAAGEYKNKAERDKIFNELLDLGIKESVRIFVVAPINGFIAGKDVKGVVDDLAAGIGNRWTEMLAFKQGAKELKIGAKYVHKWAWNPVGGYQDVYSVIIHQGMVDGFMWNNPYNGNKIPLLAKSWKIIKDVTVPTSAVIYNYKAHKWEHVKPGTKAKFAIELNLLNNLGVFHDGQKVRFTDILYWVYLISEWGTKSGKNDTRYDSYVASTWSTWISKFKGIQIVKPNKIIIYTDMYHFDPNELADMVSGAIAPSVPWELLYAMEQAVEHTKLAFSPTAAQVKGGEWLDSLNPNHVNIVLKYLEQDQANNVIPPQVSELGKLLGINVKPDYNAVISFIKKHGHMVIGNGPLYLDSYDPNSDSAILKAFRNPNYPFSASQFSYLAYENVQFAQVTSVNTNTPVLVPGQPIEVTINIVDKNTKKPLDKALAFVAIYDSNGNLAYKGFAKEKAPGNYYLSVPGKDTANWSPGTYTVKVIAYSSQAFWPSIMTTTFIVLG